MTRGSHPFWNRNWVNLFLLRMYEAWRTFLHWVGCASNIKKRCYHELHQSDQGTRTLNWSWPFVVLVGHHPRKVLSQRDSHTNFKYHITSREVATAPRPRNYENPHRTHVSVAIVLANSLYRMLSWLATRMLAVIHQNCRLYMTFPYCSHLKQWISDDCPQHPGFEVHFQAHFQAVPVPPGCVQDASLIHGPRWNGHHWTRMLLGR